jgi:hypothetical protein
VPRILLTSSSARAAFSSASSNPPSATSSYSRFVLRTAGRITQMTISPARHASKPILPRPRAAKQIPRFTGHTFPGAIRDVRYLEGSSSADEMAVLGRTQEAVAGRRKARLM